MHSLVIRHPSFLVREEPAGTAHVAVVDSVRGVAAAVAVGGIALWVDGEGEGEKRKDEEGGSVAECLAGPGISRWFATCMEGPSRLQPERLRCGKVQAVQRGLRSMTGQEGERERGRNGRGDEAEDAPSWVAYASSS